MTKTEAYTFTDLATVESLEWLSKALGQDEARHSLMQLRVEKNCAVATDGKRLHKWNYSIGIPTGNYRLIIIKIPAFDFEDTEMVADQAILINTDHDYPKWQRVIPDHRESIDLTIYENGHSYIPIKTGVCLNFNFLKDALPDGTSVVNVKYGKPIDPIVIEYSDRLAVIMGLRTQETEATL